MRWWQRVLALALALLSFTVLAAGYRATLTPVTLIVDGEPVPINTHQTTVEMLLSDLGVSLRTEDRLSPGLHLLRQIWRSALTMRSLS